MPKGYIIANIDLHDLVAWDEYKKRAVPHVHSFGGRYLIASDAFEEREQPSNLKRLVVIEFPTLSAAKATYDDPHYRAEILPYRLKAANSSLTIIEGRDDG